jgi:gliding motility-associated-like protein
MYQIYIALEVLKNEPDLMEPSKLPFFVFNRSLSPFKSAYQYSSIGVDKSLLSGQLRAGMMKILLSVTCFFAFMNFNVVFSQTIFTTNTTGNWTTLAWSKSGTATTATYPGQPGHESEVHDVAINGASVVVTLNSNIISSIRNIAISGASLAITSHTLTMTGNLSGTGSVSFTNGTINIAGNNLSTGTFSGSTGTMHYNGANQTVRGGIIYYNLVISGSGTKTLNGNVSVNRDFTVNSGIFQSAHRNFSVTGTTSIFSGGVFTTNSNLGTKSFNDVVLSGGTISNSSGSSVTMNILGNLLVNNNAVSTLIDINSTISLNTVIDAGASLTFGGSSGSKIFSGPVTVNGSWNNSVNEPVSFSNGLTFNGLSFTSGTSQYTFNTNFQNIAGSQPITFDGIISVNTPAVLNNRSTVTIKGGLTGSGTWRNDNGSVLNYEVAAMPGISNFIAGTNSNYVNYSLSADQQIRAGSYYHIRATGNGIKTLQGSVTINGDLQVGTGITLDAGPGNHAINLRGAWQNDGTFNRRAGSVAFSGTGPQTLTRSSGQPEEFYSLEINSTGPVTSDVDLKVNNLLTMIKGVVIMPGKKLSLGTSASEPGTLSYTTGWITGVFSRWVIPGFNNTDMIFPVGSETHGRRMTLNFQNTTTPGILDAVFVNSSPSAGGLPLFEDIYYLNQLFPEGYWNLTRDALFDFTGTFDLQLVPSGFNTFPLDAATRVLSRTGGGDWYLNGSHMPGSALTIGRNTLDSFANDYAVAFAEVCEASFQNCPSDITVNSLPGECHNNVSWSPPTISVPCPSYSVTSNYSPGDVFGVGTTQVVYVLRNGAVETDFCTFYVTVNDNGTPVITCSDDQTRNVDISQCHYTVSGTEIDPVYTFNNCPFTLTNDLTGNSSLAGVQIPAGITTVLWTISGLSGNSASCSMDIVVNDNIAPTVTPIANRVEDVGSDCSFTIPDYRLLTSVTDNCGTPAVVQIPAPGTIISGSGMIQTITITATDTYNNSSNISFSLTLTDNTPPIALCRNISRVLDSSGNATVTVAEINNGSIDNCGIASMTLSKNSFTCDDIGTNNVTLTVTDANGNSSVCTAAITISENIAPSVTCPSNISRDIDPGLCSASVNVPDIMYSDNCSVTLLTWETTGATTSVSPASGINQIGTKVFNKGITTVTYMVKDGSGNQNSCSFTVTVTDNENPVISCPANISGNTDAGLCNATVTVPDATISDNCSVNTLTWTMTGATNAASPLTGINQVGTNLFNSGITTVTLNAKDEAGNQSSCSFTVTISDNIAPVLICPSDISGTCSISDLPPYSNFAAFLAAGGNATDNCAINPTSFILLIQASDGLNCPETFTRTYQIADMNGNISTCQQTITIDDITPPVITGTIAVVNAEGCSAADVPAPVTTVSALEAMGLNITDACTADANLTVTSSDNLSGSCPLLITRTYTITDDCGNSATAEQIINVDDSTPPVITGTITTLNSEGCSPADAPAPVTTIAALEAMGWIIDDDCAAKADLLVSSSDAVSGSCPLIITRTYTIRDKCNNSVTGVQTINIADVTVPTGSNPGPVAVDCKGDVPSPDVNVITDEADNCGMVPVVTFISDISDGNTCPEVITRTYRLTDLCGNFTDLYQTITIDDNINPTAEDPLPLLVECTGDIPVPDVNAVTGEADNCGIVPVVTFVSDVSDGNTCPEIITRTYRVTDACGNYIDVRQIITVDDTTDPVATNPVTVTLQCSGDLPAPDVNIITDESDNCGIAPVVTYIGDASDGNTCPEIITRTYRVTDPCGNFLDVIQTFIIDDKTNPSAGSLPPLTIECLSDVPAPDIDIITDESDNCAIPPVVTFVSDISNGNTCPEVITRTYRVTDNCGNYIDVIQTITIEDITPPAITGALAAINLEGCTAGDAPPPVTSAALLEAMGLVITDNCTDDALLTVSSNDVISGSCPLVVTRTYTVTDACGKNTATEQTINIIDSSIPVITGCPGDIIVSADPGACNAVITWPDYLIADNCGPLSVVSSHASGSTFPIGTTIVTLNLTDNCGNTSACSFNVTVSDTELPVITCPSSILRETDHLLNTASFTIPDAIFSDNCSVSALTWEMTGATSAASALTGINQIGAYTFNEGITSVTLSVTDVSGNITTCNFQVTIVPPEGLSGTIISRFDVTCNGDANGSVIVQGTGGYGSYEYKLDAGAYQPSGSFGSLSAGTYIVTIRDEDNTTYEVPVTITQPQPFNAEITSVNDVTCSGNADGAIDVTATGGTEPYIFSWTGTGGFTSVLADLEDLSPGSYSLTVTDANGCGTFILDAVIGEPAPLVITIDSYSDYNGFGVACNGGTDGSISSSASGGTGPYVFSWTGPAGFASSSDDITNLGSGSYSLEVTDASGCFVTSLVNITEPDPLSIEFTVTEASCPDEPDGSIELAISGGTQPYEIIWDNGAVTGLREDLVPGVYSVVVTDMNHCPGTIDITVGTVGTEACLEIPEIITPNNDNFNDTWKIRNIDLFPDAEVQVFNRWGKRVYQSRNILADPWDGTDGGKLVPTDSYHYILDLHNGSKARQGVITVIR